MPCFCVCFQNVLLTQATQATHRFRIQGGGSAMRWLLLARCVQVGSTWMFLTERTNKISGRSCFQSCLSVHMTGGQGPCTW